ncbi:hypothetical protein CRE_13417 [Caenorhabditis remanei]|uniref:Uncharacterized protein n=1 Tax=Caenorhabditis remanei TaxID=31234 RepID=E3M885_CAERE|nr:hypothetical protein CRE_13417 [Caenorhabditis remanei]
MEDEENSSFQPENQSVHGENSLQIGLEEESSQQDMEIDSEEISEERTEESSEEPSMEPSEAPPVESSDSAEAIEKSKIQKESFMEMFKIAPTIKDVLPDLRVFMEHPDVIDWDRREVQQIVELKIQEEKARKKAEKASRREQAEKQQPVVLADLIRSATGIDVAGILQKIPGVQQPPVVTAPPVMPVVQPVQPAFVAPPPTLSLSTSTITSVGHGKCGFGTPHPNEIPAELRKAKPDMIAPIPDELRVVQGGRAERKVPAIPNELLPPEQRVFESLPLVFVRPPMRKTLFLAGARCGKRSERLEAAEAEEEEKTGKKRKKNKGAEEQSFRGANRPFAPPESHRGRGGFSKPSRIPVVSGMNALPAGLNKNSPLAVKRYHARHLAKETGMTLEEAMAEIEEQCNEFGGEDTPEAREHDEKAMELIKKRGDEKWNQRYNYVPVDHSKGIPGVDRPPGVTKPPIGAKRDPVPGVDRPPIGARVDREPIPGVDRPPIGGGGREPIPGVDRPPGGHRYQGEPYDGEGDRGGRRERRRGGVKEREKKRRREEAFRGGPRGRGGGGGERGRGGRGGYDKWDERGYGGGAPKQARYDDYSSDRGYPRPYQAVGYGGYDDRRGYDDYYGRQDGYENYDGQHQYGEGGYEHQGGEGEGYAYDQHAAEAYYQGHEGQDATYYQEDGSQYYNEYYGTAEGGGGATGEGGAEYHATFDTPSTSHPPPPPPN